MPMLECDETEDDVILKSDIKRPFIGVSVVL